MSAAPEFGKVVVFGVGLIGGSFALGLKAAGIQVLKSQGAL